MEPGTPRTRFHDKPAAVAHGDGIGRGCVAAPYGWGTPYESPVLVQDRDINCIHGGLVRKCTGAEHDPRPEPPWPPAHVVVVANDSE